MILFSTGLFSATLHILGPFRFAQMFMPHMGGVAKSWFKNFQVGVCLGCCAKTRKDIEGILEPPEFEFAPRCAQA